MKPATDCLPQSASVPMPSPEKPPSGPLSPTAARTLWVRMAEIYGHRWTSSYGDSTEQDGAAGTWAKGLAGLTPAQVADGLRACVVRSDPWPPTLPEFRALCLAIPSLAETDAEVAAYIAASQRTGATATLSRFGRLALEFLDSYRWRHAQEDKADRLMRDAYEQAREHVMRGGELPEEPVALIEQEENPVKNPVDPEKVKQEMEAIKRMLRGEE